MNVYAHFWLTGIWVGLLLTELILCALVSGKQNCWWSAYCFIVAWRSLTLLTFSFRHGPEGYYATFWIGQFSLHAIVFILLAQYVLGLLKLSPRLPRSFQSTAALVMVTLAGTVLLLHSWRMNPDPSRLLSVEQGIQLWLCGLLWIACALGVSRDDSGVKLDVLRGFVALYSVGLVTASLRVFVPMTMVTLWGIDLVAQLAIVGWWIQSMRRLGKEA